MDTKDIDQPVDTIAESSCQRSSTNTEDLKKIADRIVTIHQLIRETHTQVTDKQDKYSSELLMKIRDIRASEFGTQRKIFEIFALAYDFNSEIARFLCGGLHNKLKEKGMADRFANYLMFMAEAWAMSGTPMAMNDIKKLGYNFLRSIPFNNNDIHTFSVTFENPSYQGVKVTIGDDKDYPQTVVRLPEELKNFKGSSMVLKVEDTGRLVDSFCSIDTHYRRAYAILADLDNKVMGCMEKREFPSWITIPYKEDGDALFEFSHFEVDLREPDERYRALYVVYRYDTTAS